jgi:TatD DNase family protein
VLAEAVKNKVLFCAPNATRQAEYERMMQLAQRFPLHN